MAKVDKVKQGKSNLEWGRMCEQIAAEFYLERGYVIRERNLRVGKFEIDLILEKERTIIFVEVKARKPLNQDPIDAVDFRKRRRTIAAADIYLRRLPLLYQYRFDIFAVIGTKDSYEAVQYENAFVPNVNGGR